MTNRSIGTGGAKDPEADFTIRDGIGGVSLLDRDGSVVAHMSGKRALSLFVAGAAAAGKSVYDQRTGMYMEGKCDRSRSVLSPPGASEQ